ncbi:MAG TPA: Pup--protein ligase [Dermatophilaceae bacterium]|nr:Pup--protein ligase [Dermatophilaceae bacterium]
MDRRIFGIETEYAMMCTRDGRRLLSPDEVARYMFRGIVARARSSNAFLPNGGRLYLDVGNHPEYATAECDSLVDLLAQDGAGERIVQGLVEQALERMTTEGITASVYAFKNNVDSAGNSYGCHENYLVARSSDLGRITTVLVPFLLTRQIICGAGRIVPGLDGSAQFCLSQRADVMWEGASSATTRSRPMINTRDEPHADSEHYRRLHVIVGDSNMNQATTMLKVGSTDLLLRTLEAGAHLPDLIPLSPPKAIRVISRDLTGTELVPLASGSAMSALQIQREYFRRVADHLDKVGVSRPLDAEVLALWDRALSALERDDPEAVAGEIDWIAKYRLLRRHAQRHDLGWSDPRMAQLELAYHDIDPDRGLFASVQRRGGAARVVGPDQIEAAVTVPPQTTRARLRGAFVEAAQAHGRDYTVDWSHMRLNDIAQRTVLCKDPFAACDARIDRLLASIDPAG